MVLTGTNEADGIAMLIMNRPPANSLSLEMNEAICNSIREVEADPKIQSLIITSVNKSIFCAGLDVAELVDPDEERLRRFTKLA